LKREELKKVKIKHACDSIAYSAAKLIYMIALTFPIPRTGAAPSFNSTNAIAFLKALDRIFRTQQGITDTNKKEYLFKYAIPSEEQNIENLTGYSSAAYANFIKVFIKEYKH
jgi:hypothetical protein